MLLFIIIYLAGYVCSYYTFRYLYISIHKEWDWEDVKYNAKTSFASWVTFLISLIFYIAHKVGEYSSKNKPPRWL